MRAMPLRLIDVDVKLAAHEPSISALLMQRTPIRTFRHVSIHIQTRDLEIRVDLQWTLVVEVRIVERTQMEIVGVARAMASFGTRGLEVRRGKDGEGM